MPKKKGETNTVTDGDVALIASDCDLLQQLQLIQQQQQHLMMAAGGAITPTVAGMGCGGGRERGTQPSYSGIYTNAADDAAAPDKILVTPQQIQAYMALVQQNQLQQQTQVLLGGLNRIYGRQQQQHQQQQQPHQFHKPQQMLQTSSTSSSASAVSNISAAPPVDQKPPLKKKKYNTSKKNPKRPLTAYTCFVAKERSNVMADNPKVSKRINLAGSRCVFGNSLKCSALYPRVPSIRSIHLRSGDCAPTFVDTLNKVIYFSGSPSSAAKAAFKDIAKITGQRWRALSEAEREPFRLMAVQDIGRFRTEKVS
eukprot:gene12900-3638_t